MRAHPHTLQQLDGPVWWLQASCVTGSIGCRPVVLPVQSAVGQLCYRFNRLQASCVTDSIGCRPVVLPVQSAVGQLCYPAGSISCRPVVLPVLMNHLRPAGSHSQVDQDSWLCVKPRQLRIVHHVLDSQGISQRQGEEIIHANTAQMQYYKELFSYIRLIVQVFVYILTIFQLVFIINRLFLFQRMQICMLTGMSHNRSFCSMVRRD